jgi:O-antigen/teichoic acid export membrane protein
VRKYFYRAFGLARSQTAKDTYILFVGNIAAAFLGFIFTLIIARALSVEDFGILSAATNLIIIIASFTDLGISSGLVTFVSAAFAGGDEKRESEYSKAAFVVKLMATLPIALFLVIFARYVATNWMATDDPAVSYWVATISLVGIFWVFLPFILQAKKKFLQSIVIDVSLSFLKVVIPYALFLVGLLTINTTLAAFAFSSIVAGAIGLWFVKTRFLRARPDKKIYLDLVKFSSWIAVNRIISSISGKLDVQMLAAIAGATTTGFYSIPSKLSSFLIVLASSFSAVLAPRFASFGDKKNEKRYLIKASLALVPVVAGIVLWMLIAQPFIVILFGEKYVSSVPVFQALVASLIPYIIAIPAVTAIIYALKKTIFIGLFSFFQIAAIVLLNYILIPKVGPFGPTIAFGVVHTILAIYTWTIVIKYYWIDK